MSIYLLNTIINYITYKINIVSNLSEKNICVKIIIFNKILKLIENCKLFKSS